MRAVVAGRSIETCASRRDGDARGHYPVHRASHSGNSLKPSVHAKRTQLSLPRGSRPAPEPIGLGRSRALARYRPSTLFRAWHCQHHRRRDRQGWQGPPRGSITGSTHVKSSSMPSSRSDSRHTGAQLIMHRRGSAREVQVRWRSYSGRGNTRAGAELSHRVGRPRPASTL